MPRSAVIELMGRVSILDMISQISNITDPVSSVAGTSTRWSEVRNIIRVTCGIASPIKPIGPQNAVTVPASRVVERKRSALDLLMSSPIVRAYSSPNSNKLSGLMVTMARMIPAATAGKRIQSCETVTSPNDPIVQITKALSDSSRLRYCKICTTALIPDENIMPRIRITIISFIREATAPTMKSTAAEPIQAAPAIPKDDIVGDIPNKGAPSKNRATPRDAPELIPSTYGPASGFRKSVCI